MTIVYRSLVVGIPTYNRKHFVEANAKSLRNAVRPEGIDVHFLVVDDASSEYDVGELTSIYPQGSTVIRREANSGGADRAICDLFRRCVAYNADAVLLLDSDMIVGPNFIAEGLKLLAHSDGIVSLFNTLNHAATEDCGPMVFKKTVGSAGTLWDQKLAREISEMVETGRAWDWRFCDYINQSGRKIFCSRNSLMQHIGYSDGENSYLESGDFGVGFIDSNVENISMTLEVIVRSQIAIGKKLAAQQVSQNKRISELEYRIKKLEKYSIRHRVKGMLRRLKYRRLNSGDTVS